MCLPFDEIVTTNYDSNLDWFLSRSLRTAKGYTTFSDVYDRDTLAKSFDARRDSRVVYLHGRAGKSRLVFDRFDYASLMSERDGVFDFVTHLLRDATTIYVGFGLDDPSFNLVEDRLHSLEGKRRPTSFAFVPGATAQEREAWKSRNLRLIEFGDFRELPGLIKDQAFLGLEAKHRPSNLHHAWLNAIAMQIAAYSALVMSERGEYFGPTPTSKAFKRLVKMSNPARIVAVRSAFMKCNHSRGRNWRTDLFTNAYQLASEELAGVDQPASEPTATL